DPIARQRLRQKLRRIPLFVAEKHWFVLNQGHAGSQANKSLRELAADRAATDNEQPLRTLSQIEDVLVGEIPRRLEARDRRTHGARPSRDHRMPEAQYLG